MMVMMTRRAMYRWKSFWLGVLVMAVMVWGWVHSMRMGEKIMLEGKHVDSSSVALVGGSFIASTQFVRMSDAYRWQRFSWPMGNDEGSPVWAFREWDRRSLMMQWVAFPLWVPMVAWSAVWGGWLVWRGRKERRVMRGEARRTSNIERPTLNDE